MEEVGPVERDEGGEEEKSGGVEGGLNAIVLPLSTTGGGWFWAWVYACVRRGHGIYRKQHGTHSPAAQRSAGHGVWVPLGLIDDGDERR